MTKSGALSFLKRQRTAQSLKTAVNNAGRAQARNVKV